MSATSTGRIDPDELALLEEERDHLLGSLEDLEREFAAGDMDEVDYRSLKDDYTGRAAAVLETIEQQRSNLRTAAPTRRPAVTAAIVVGVVIFAVGAGLLVARSSGQRGGGAITGAVGTQRAELATCQTASFQDPEGGIECYAAILEDAPDLVEALTYQGWAMVRSGDVEGGTANFARAVELEPDYPDVRVFRAVVAARAGDHALAAEEIDRFYANDPSPAAIQVLNSQQLEREVFIFLLDDATRACWQESATGDDGETQDAQGFVTSLGACLDQVLAADPSNVDALVSASYVAASSDDLDGAVELARRAVAADPEDPNARLLDGSLALTQRRTDDARAALEIIETMQRPTASFLLGSPEQMQQALESMTDDGATTTSAPLGDAVEPTDTLVPNPDGG